MDALQAQFCVTEINFLKARLGPNNCVFRYTFMLASALGTLKAYVANNEGLLFVIAAEGFFALMNLSVKILGEDVSVLEVIVDQMTG
jgi:hypothetical protein